MINRLQRAWRELVGSPHQKRYLQWDAARPVSRIADWSPQPGAPNSPWSNPSVLRARAAQEFANNPIARRGVNSLANACWGGSGVLPLFRDRTVQALWERWSRACDASGRLDWIGVGAQILTSVIVAGEAFVVLRLDEAAPGVPLTLQVLGPEYLDESKVDATTIAGIRYDGLRPAGYWLFKQNPTLAGASAESVFVPADQVLHVYRPLLPNASRGQSWLAPALIALNELASYLEASLVRARVGAVLCAFVRAPEGYPGPLQQDGTLPSLEPGSVVRLQPGEDIEFTEPPATDAAFDPFVRTQLRRIAAGLGIPYELLSGDLSQVTFASGRAGLLEFKRTIEAIQYGLLIPLFCEPVLRRWSELARAVGVLPGDADTEARRWVAPEIEMLDRRAEVLTDLLRVRAGFASRSEIIGRTGWRAEDVDSEIAADNARADALGLVFDSDARRRTQQGQNVPDVVAAGSEQGAEA
jgi:lambda family phage portal protein